MGFWGVEAFDILKHGLVEIPLLFLGQGASRKRLQMQLEGGDRAFQFMGHRIDKVALPAIQIDLLDTQYEIENDPGDDAGKHRRPDTQQRPIGSEDVDQDPADGQADQEHDHGHGQNDRPSQAFSLEHVCCWVFLSISQLATIGQPVRSWSGPRVDGNRVNLTNIARSLDFASDDGPRIAVECSTLDL